MQASALGIVADIREIFEGSPWWKLLVLIVFLVIGTWYARGYIERNDVSRTRLNNRVMAVEKQVQINTERLNEADAERQQVINQLHQLKAGQKGIKCIVELIAQGRIGSGELAGCP